MKREPQIEPQPRRHCEICGAELAGQDDLCCIDPTNVWVGYPLPQPESAGIGLPAREEQPRE